MSNKADHILVGHNNKKFDINAWVLETAGVLNYDSKGSVQVSVLNERGRTIGFRSFDYTVEQKAVNFEDIKE